MTLALITAVFVASLVGSLHCAGMCGGIIALCVNGKQIGTSRPVRSWQPHAAYNIGRLATYASLGAVSGLIGSAIDLGGAAIGVTRVALVLAGVTMICIGIAALLRHRGVRFGCLKLPPALNRLLQRSLTAAQRLPATRRSLVIGLLTGFLPCGWLYAFVIASAGTGSAAMGALTMSAFWLGTVPIMLSIGLGMQHIMGPLKKHVPALSAIVLMLVGMIAITGRLTVPTYADQLDSQMSNHNGSTADQHVASQIDAINAITLPCCQLTNTAAADSSSNPEQVAH